jgi:ABC-type Fe3+/spermidine/putrescine transport system ATPase subunit
VRPERVEVQVDPDELLYFNQTQAYISHISYSGSSVKYHLETESNESFLAFEQGGRHTKAPKLGQQVRITWSPEHTRLLQE